MNNEEYEIVSRPLYVVENSNLKLVLLIPNKNDSNMEDKLSIDESFNKPISIYTRELTSDMENEILKTDEFNVTYSIMLIKNDLTNYINKIIEILDAVPENATLAGSNGETKHYALCTDFMPSFLTVLLEEALSEIPKNKARLHLFNGIYDHGAMFAISTISENLRDIFKDTTVN